MFASTIGASADPGVDTYGFGTDAGVEPIMAPLNPVTYNDPLFNPADAGQVDYLFGGTVQTGFDTAGMDNAPALPTPDVPVYTDTPPVVIADDGNTGNFGRDALDFLTQAAIAAIKVNQAYQATQQKPPVRINTNPASGPVATAGGMLVTRNPLTGATQTARPQAGTPYALGDGSGRVIINNGDGTYDVISANGARQHLTYPSGVPGEPTNWGLLALIGIGGMFALKALK
jgi:hypothetical protein